MKRLEKKFQELKAQGQCAFVTYICAGDPNLEISLEIFKNLPQAGADIIELGVPFLDPSGDGPTIEDASKRAIGNGASLVKTLRMVQEFRKNNNDTPVILMGYFNPFLKYGLDKFFVDAENCGVDGVLIVDLPLEERKEIKQYIAKTNIDVINLIAPLSDEARIKKIADKNVSSGFLYLISMLGITGTKAANVQENIVNLEKIRKNSDLPVVIGFGIQNANQAQQFSKIGVDGVVVGSVIVKEIGENFLAKKSAPEIIENALNKVREFSQAIKRK